MTTPHERSVGAQLERRAMRAWVRRQEKALVASTVAKNDGFFRGYSVAIRDVKWFIEGRVKRYDKRGGGLGRR